MLRNSCLIAAAMTFVAAATADACPFCPGASPTLSEQTANSEAALLVQWVSATRAASDAATGTTTFEVVDSIKGPPATTAKGSRVVVGRFREGQPGSLFLLLGRREPAATPAAAKSGPILWDEPLETTEIGYQYLKQAPTPETPAPRRLPYFVRFLEFSDPAIARDAYFEFANGQYADVAEIGRTMSREKVRNWIASPDTDPVRLGLYGMLLGLCGDKQKDAPFLAQIVFRETTELRLGVDGLIGGYLLLTGEEGLDRVDAAKLKDRGEPATETFSAMAALRFLWTYAENRIPPARLKESMRLILDRPDMADIALTDLARWRDWEIQERVFDLFGKPKYEAPIVRRAIVGYLLASTRDVPEGKNAADLPHVQRGLACLTALRERDPVTVMQAERLFGF